MNSRILTIFLIPLILSIGISPVLPFDIVQEADALKGKGVYNQKYGSETKHIVCGDRLCSATDIPTIQEKPMPVSTKDSRPNVLLIVLDDVGFSDLGFTASEIDTPVMNSLADSEIFMTNYHVSPTCSPTRAMLLTGVDNHQAGLGTMNEFIEKSKMKIN